jgi:hypothetical protein
MSNYERNRDLEIIGYNKNIIVTMYYLKEILSRLDVDYLKHRSKVCHGKAPIDTSDPKLKLSKNDLDGAFLTEAMVFLEGGHSISIGIQVVGLQQIFRRGKSQPVLCQLSCD